MPKLVETAYKYLYVREEPKGSNRGPEIDAWLTALGSPLGSAWCAAFVHGCLKESGDTRNYRRSARVQDMVDAGQLLPAEKATLGDLIVFYFPKLERYAHIGIVVGKTPKRLDVIEGNGIPDGATGDQREGYGVVKKSRFISDHIKVLRAK